jgi:outer membrane protein TolC
MMRSVIFKTITLIVFIHSLSALAADRNDLAQELATQAVKANPKILSIESQIEALKQKVDSVRMWSDPVLGVDYINVPWDSWSLGETPMSGIQFKVKQTFPLPGKNERRQAVAKEELQIKKWQLLEQQNKLQAMVKQAYWKLALARNLKQITTRHIELVGQLVAAVRAKYQVGKSGQHDLLRLKVLKKKLQDDLYDFDRQDKQLTAAINAALHRDNTLTVVTPNEFEAVKPDKTPADYFRLAQENRPLLKQTEATSNWHRRIADTTAFERWPDVTLWAGYRIRTSAGVDPGTDFFSVGLSVPLPIDYNNRYQAKEAEHLILADAAEHSRRSAEDQIKATLETSLAAWERAYQKVTFYRKELILEADRTLKATLAAYRTDRADFASLFQAELQLLQFDRAILIAKVTTQLEQVKVELEVGTRLDNPKQ